MNIKIQDTPRAIWHMDCAATACGIVKVMQHRADLSLVVCLDCGAEATIPVGVNFGVCFKAEELKKCSICYPKHCTDTAHGECWCSPTHEEALIIHQQAS